MRLSSSLLEALSWRVAALCSVGGCVDVGGWCVWVMRMIG